MASYAAGSRFLSLIGGTIVSFYDWYADLPPASPQSFGDQTDVPESGDWWNVAAASGAPIVYQVHAIIAWLFWASFPFSRLVHAWSIPLQYIGRPYILYRRRYSTAR